MRTKPKNRQESPRKSQSLARAQPQPKFDQPDDPVVPLLRPGSGRLATSVTK